MSRKVAVAWHASFSIIAGVLYFFFVLPRFPELRGTTTHTLGTVLRIVTGALIGLAALPVVFTLQRTRRPELGTPRLALSLRTSSIGHDSCAATGDRWIEGLIPSSDAFPLHPNESSMQNAERVIFADLAG